MNTRKFSLKSMPCLPEVNELNQYEYLAPELVMWQTEEPVQIFLHEAELFRPFLHRGCICCVERRGQVGKYCHILLPLRGLQAYNVSQCQSLSRGSPQLMGLGFIAVKTNISWIRYERGFNELYLSIWNQLVFNQRLWFLFIHHSCIYWFLSEETKCVFPTYWSISKLVSEFHRTNHKEFKCKSSFCVNYFLRYDAASTYCEKS